MKSTIIALASALLLAVAITELSTRLWPGSHLALLLLSFLALLVNGLFNRRQNHSVPAAGFAARDNTEPSRTRDHNRKPQNRDKRGPKREGGKQRSPSSSDQRSSSKPAEVPEGPREEGTVKWFNRSKGFGFVIRDNGEEIFVHQRSIRSEDGKGRPVLKDGETVSYVVAERERGLQAEDVVPAGAG